jgi:hypothetical protein
MQSNCRDQETARSVISVDRSDSGRDSGRHDSGIRVGRLIRRHQVGGTAGGANHKCVVIRSALVSKWAIVRCPYYLGDLIHRLILGRFLTSCHPNQPDLAGAEEPEGSYAGRNL